MVVSMLMHIKHICFFRSLQMFCQFKSETVYLQVRQRISSSLTMWMHLVWSWITLRTRSSSWRHLLNLSFLLEHLPVLTSLHQDIHLKLELLRCLWDLYHQSRPVRLVSRWVFKWWVTVAASDWICEHRDKVNYSPPSPSYI